MAITNEVLKLNKGSSVPWWDINVTADSVCNILRGKFYRYGVRQYESSRLYTTNVM
jgi:hypothetical protein